MPSGAGGAISCITARRSNGSSERPAHSQRAARPQLLRDAADDRPRDGALHGTRVVVPLPGSNRYISGLRPPVELLRANGLNICVGTDSLASNGALSLVDELRLLGDGVPLAERLLWATAGGAAALGFGDELGEIVPGRRPGVVVLEGIDFSAMRLLPESRTTRLA